MLACLISITPLDATTGTRFPVRLSSAADRSVCALNNLSWDPSLKRAPAIGMQFWNGDFVTGSDPGRITFAINLRQLKRSVPSITDAVWMGAQVEAFVGQVGDAWPWTSYFKGRVTAYAGDSWPTMQITATVDAEPFNVDVLTSVYGGTGDAEGGADIKGKVKPLALGWPRNVEPVLINAVDSVYQFSAYGAIEAVEGLYERGSAFPASSGDFADYAALVAATVPPGGWATCLAQGMVRLGAPAYGVITGDLKGHAVSGTAPRGAGALVDLAASIAGISSSLISSSTLADLDGEGASNSDMMVTDQIKFLDLARRLILPCNWQPLISNAGVLHAIKPAFGTEAFTLHAQGKRVPLVVDSTESQVSFPYRKTTMAAERCWRVHSFEEIATSYNLVDRGTYDAGTTYREGNIVTMADGSRWLFISTTPQAGITPGTDALVWEEMVEASSASASRVTPRLTKPVDAVFADAAGTVPSFAGTGGTFTLVDDNGDPVTGATFSVVSSTGVTVSINATTGAYAPSAMSAAQGSATFRATIGSTTYDAAYSISKQVSGAAGFDMRISPPSVHLPMTNAGVVTSYASATFSVVVTKLDGTDISSNFALSTDTGGNPSGLTVSYVGQTGTITAGLDANESSAPLTVKATGSGAYAGVILKSTFTLNKDAAALALSEVATDNQHNALVPNTPTGMSSISIGRTYSSGNVSLYSSFSFSYSSDPANRNNVDHFELGVWVADDSTGHTMGTDVKEEWQMVVMDMTAATTFAPFFAIDVAGNRYYTLGVRACRKVHPSVNPSGWVKSAIRQVGPFRPSAYQVIDKDNVYLGDMLFSTVRQAALNLNADNDANALVPPAATGVTLSGVNFTNSMGQVTVAWTYTHSLTPSAANNIDGFIVGLMTRSSSAGYTYSPSDDALIVWQTAQITDRACKFNVGAVEFYNTAIVIPYRAVRTDIDGSGVIEAAPAQSSSTTPYRLTSAPSYLGLIDTQTAANVADGTARARVGLTSGGDVATGKVLTGSIATDALNKAGWAAFLSGIYWPVSNTAGPFVVTASVAGNNVLAQLVLDYQINITDPVLGEEPSFTVRLFAYRTSTGVYTYSDTFTISDAWNQATTTGTKKFARDSVGLEYNFTGLAAGSYQFGYTITTNSRCQVWSNGPQYMRIEDKKAIS